MMTAQDKKTAVERIAKMQADGVTKHDALATLANDVRLAYIFDHAQLRSMVDTIYGYADERDARRGSEATRQANALKLYDALVAAGWTPPA